MKRISSFREIELHKIEYVSFHSDSGITSQVYGSQLHIGFLQTLDTSIFQYAFVNMIGGEFIIVDKTE